MVIDVTDATFEQEVVERSNETPVVIDLWAEWCGPCKVLGPILEKAVESTDGRVVLAKVDVDDNRQVAAAFQVQGIPAVYAMKEGKVVGGFVGAQGEQQVREFVDQLLPSDEDLLIQGLISAGDEESLHKVLEMVPDHEGAALALGSLLIADGRGDEALEVLARLPETGEVRHLAALARTGADVTDQDIETNLDALLEQVKEDDGARQQFLDLLERLEPDDPRRGLYRKKLTARLF